MYELTKTFTDDESYALPASTTGWGTVHIGDNLINASFSWKVDGTVNIGLNLGTDYAVDSDTDGKFCIYNNGGIVTLKNRLGSSQIAIMTLNYSGAPASPGLPITGTYSSNLKTSAQLREITSRFLYDWFSFTTTTNIGVGVTIISTSLNSYHDDYFKDNWYVLITSGNNSGVKRIVSGSVQSTGALAVYGANLLAESGSVTFELHKFDPDEIKAAINEASARPGIYPRLSVHNFLPNNHFEDWSQTTYPDYWRVSNVTSVVDTTYIHNGAKSAKVTRAGTDGYLYISTSLGTTVLPQDVYDKLMNLRGTKVKFQRWVKASTALQARISIICGSDAGNCRYSPYHSGGGALELLEVEFDIPWDVGEVGFRCEVNNSDGAAYFDGAGRSETGAVPGFGYLSSVTSDTDAIEVNTLEANALCCMAAAIFKERYARATNAEDRNTYKQDAAALKAEALSLLSSVPMTYPTIKANFGWLV